MEITDTAMTPEEMEKQGRINALRQLLNSTDYIAIKRTEGMITDTEYATVQTQRRLWRDELSALEAEPTLTDLRKAKRAELRVACENAIVAGVDVSGKHYSLTDRDQIELLAQSSALKEGAATVTYHADGELCESMPAEAFAAVATAATAHIFYHRTYCNHVYKWAGRATKTELKKISYGATLPDDLAAHMAEILAAAGGGTQ